MLVCNNETALDSYNAILALLMVIMATGALLINHYTKHYSYINYFPPHSFSVFILLALMTYGSLLALGATAKLTQSCYFICQFYLVISLIAYLTIAAQLTPFAVIDSLLVRLDRLWGYDTGVVLNTIVRYPAYYQILSKAYASIVPELALVPVMLALAQQFATLKRLYFMLLATSSLGFMCYYFWPTTAPASIITNAHFLVAQHATALKFYQIHHYLPISTSDGGLVAMPSFHVIWACLCQQSVRHFTCIWWLLLPINGTMVLACVLLGWHYLSDIFGSVIVIAVCYLILRTLEKRASLCHY